ncbi:hypothetical protein B0H11DRAFT_2041344 [Mycena galericulata]|nr:hypothetical protein B0H11DRAFT_2041344 [Mycena galericulata]
MTRNTRRVVRPRRIACRGTDAHSRSFAIPLLPACRGPGALCMGSLPTSSTLRPPKPACPSAHSASIAWIPMSATTFADGRHSPIQLHVVHPLSSHSRSHPPTRARARSSGLTTASHQDRHSRTAHDGNSAGTNTRTAPPAGGGDSRTRGGQDTSAAAGHAQVRDAAIHARRQTTNDISAADLTSSWITFARRHPPVHDPTDCSPPPDTSHTARRLTKAPGPDPCAYVTPTKKDKDTALVVPLAAISGAGGGSTTSPTRNSRDRRSGGSKRLLRRRRMHIARRTPHVARCDIWCQGREHDEQVSRWGISGNALKKDTYRTTLAASRDLRRREQVSRSSMCGDLCARGSVKDDARRWTGLRHPLPAALKSEFSGWDAIRG